MSCIIIVFFHTSFCSTTKLKSTSGWIYLVTLLWIFIIGIVIIVSFYLITSFCSTTKLKSTSGWNLSGCKDIELYKSFNFRGWYLFTGKHPEPFMNILPRSWVTLLSKIIQRSTQVAIHFFESGMFTTRVDPRWNNLGKILEQSWLRSFQDLAMVFIFTMVRSYQESHVPKKILC